MGTKRTFITTFEDLDDLDFEFKFKSENENNNNSYHNNKTPLKCNITTNNNIKNNKDYTTTSINQLPYDDNNTSFNQVNHNEINNQSKVNVLSSDVIDLFNSYKYNSSTPKISSNTTITTTTTTTSTHTPTTTNNNNINHSTTKKQTILNTPKSNMIEKIKTPSSKITNNIPISSKTPVKSKDPCYFALTENKSREIGFASYNTINGVIEIGQFCDSQTYVHLYTKLFIQEISLIVTPPLKDDSELLKMIINRFPNIEITTIPRKIFNENNGIELIRQYSIPENLLLLNRNVSSKYLAQAAFSALVKYLEGMNDITFSNGCLQISYSSSDRTMHIDAESIKNLELIHNSLNGTRDHTLFSSLNHTRTPQGSRLLIRNIVQPPTDITTIKMRQDSIKEILSNEKIFFSIGPILAKLKDLDQMLVTFTLKSDLKAMNISKIQRYIKSIIEFKNILEILPKLYSTLSGMKSTLLQSIYNNISNPILNNIKDETIKYFNEKPPILKSSLANVIVYSIKDGVNGLLDVCKKTYNETLTDINNLVAHYQEIYKMPNIKVHHNSSKGFHLSVVCKNKLLLQLPSNFIGVTYKKNKCEFVTEDLISLSRRNKEVFEEILLLTTVSVENLVDFYRERLSSLFNISESISLLDLLMSLATYVTLNDCVCPEFYIKGPLAIKQGYHPLYLTSRNNSNINQITTFVPNNTMLTETSNFQILHGPNMSGKTTYIEQVVLLSIIAHIGSYVPAKFMSTPIIDKLFTRIGTSDSLQSNASTFMTEMAEISYILECATDRSLVIVDELGRGTSNIEGSSIAWAICEKIANIGCMTLFVTHYQELLEMSNIYPMIRNYHLSVTREDDKLKYGYSLSEGISQIKRYGIDIAEISGIDENVIEIARTISQKLATKKENNSTQQTIHPARTAFQLVQKLLNIEHLDLNEKQLVDYINDHKEQYSIDLNSQLLK